ncbi:MobQ family relaxase [Virgibacillus siamensis]|uniref:MobQ family relaxase n=1 Tax=Virgibacillus siamensis TaxID=480071 RepID=UPI0009868647|nr:MobQ family relaxase [Virgibacillus siamensis]
MAIYHFSGQMISRGKGQSSIAAAAYRSSEKLYSERYDKINDYSRLVKPDSFILSPDNAPKWTNNREQLWNEVEKIEKQKNAQLAREFNVALPVELSNDQQRKLAKDFCQDAFVNEGMVADISIHRDDIKNPHFHVMLTTRGFKENGEWDAKASKIKQENGKEKRINKTNWGDRETFQKWRGMWADYANDSLERNGYEQRVSHKSHKELNKQEEPTIHEGYFAQKMGDDSERVSFNNEIRKHNQKVVQLHELKQEREKLKEAQKIARNFSPEEKKTIAQEAKQLKMFVSFRNIKEKEKMLERWEYSTLKNSTRAEDRSKTLHTIHDVKARLQNVDAILSKEANRFLDKHYPDINKDVYSDFAKKYMVDAAVTDNHIFGNEEAKKLLQEGEQEHVNHELSTLIQNRHYSYTKIKNENEQLSDTFNNLVKVYRIDFNKPKTFNRLDSSIQQKVESTFKRKQSTDKALTFLNEHYNNQLKRFYGDDIGSDMTINEKELIVGFSEYFEKPVSLQKDNAEVDLFRFTTVEKEQIIDVLHNYLHNKPTKPDVETRFAEVLSGNAAVQQYFVAECKDTKDLSVESEAKLDEVLSSYEPENQAFISFNDTRSIRPLSSMVQAAENTLEKSLKQADYAEREKVQEMKRLQNRQRNKGLGR